ncbi:hypothetical protein NDA01_21615 [Trichocoleus desertorum AS-A10]|uniref:hypothetical protein n=1 Tax=Trichocoleus desertorum TaxID=1481672 RepID=UPI003297D124
MNSGIGGAGAMVGTVCTMAGAAVGFIYFLGPCLGGGTTKVIPLDASWDRPTGAAQTVCAAGSGAISDIFANLFKGQTQGRVAGTIPITGRGVGLPEGDRRTQNDVSKNPTIYNGPYNHKVSPQEEYRIHNPNAPEGATENNQDGGFNVPFFRNTNNYTYNGQPLTGTTWQYVEQPQSAGPQDKNGDGVISLGEVTE